MECKYDLLPDIENNIPTYSLDQYNSALLFNNILSGASPYTHFDEFFYLSIKNISLFPISLIRSLIKFKTNPSFPGALLIRNLPVDLNLPGTPKDGGRSMDKRTFVSESVLITITHFLGTIFSYRQEKEGELIHNICPVKRCENERSNAGAVQDFLLHTELAFFEHRPDYLAIFCLKSHFNSSEGFTTLALNKKAVQNLSKNDFDLLCQPIYEIGIPESFSKGNDLFRPTAIITNPDHPSQLCVNLNSIRSKTQAGEKALLNLKNLLEQSMEKIFLQEGDMLIIDNRKSVHGRTAFRPAFDGRDRWLQRVYVKSDLWDAHHLMKDASCVLESLV